MMVPHRLSLLLQARAFRPDREVQAPAFWSGIKFIVLLKIPRFRGTPYGCGRPAANWCHGSVQVRCLAPLSPVTEK
jgi:hypothetical protein